MKYGNVKDPDKVNFQLPEDHPETALVLTSNNNSEEFKVYVGCPKWTKSDLKGFYPRGTKDELIYYATQFNSIELNATFYNKFSTQQIQLWAEKTPPHFRFFPKMHQMVSHLKRLNNVTEMVEEFCDTVVSFENRLGMVFLQMHDNFKFKDFDRLVKFVDEFPSSIPLAVELRNKEYFSKSEYASQLYGLLESHNVTNILTDTAGHRELLHMRLTSPYAFIRFVGTNRPSDFSRVNDWVERIKKWKEMGLKQVYFFVHQNMDKESPMVAAYFIRKVNEKLGLNLHVPMNKEEAENSIHSLFQQNGNS